MSGDDDVSATMATKRNQDGSLSITITLDGDKFVESTEVFLLLDSPGGKECQNSWCHGRVERTGEYFALNTPQWFARCNVCGRVEVQVDRDGGVVRTGLEE